MNIGWGAILIIVLAIGIILSNIMLLRKTAHMKMPESVVQRAQEKRRREKEQKQKMADDAEVKEVNKDTTSSDK